MAFNPAATATTPETGVGTASQLWDVATGRELTRLLGHYGPIITLAFAPDGRRLASGLDDTTVLIWDVAAWA